MISFGRKKEESVGLDIGTHSIKIISIEKSPGKNILTSYNIKQIPQKEEKELEAILREAFNEISFHPKVVNLALSGPETIVRFINFPKMDKLQLENALSFEAEKHIPFNISEVVMDSVILGDVPETREMRVLLAAAKREKVEKLVNMIESLNMEVGLMDVDSFSVFNAFTSSNTISSEKGSAFLNMGHSQVSILISIGASPYFMREIPMQGLDDLAKEILASFHYFESRYNIGVGDVFCSGGMVYQAGTIESLANKLGIECKLWNPIVGLDISENLSKQDIDSVASCLAVSVGLALRT